MVRFALIQTDLGAPLHIRVKNHIHERKNDNPLNAEVIITPYETMNAQDFDRAMIDRATSIIGKR